MTLEDVFFKAAADRFNEVKMAAGWADLLAALQKGYAGKNPGLTKALGKMGRAWRGMTPEAQRMIGTQALAVPVGAIAGYNMGGEYDENGQPRGIGSRLLGAGMGALGGIGLGHLAGSAPVSGALSAWSGAKP